MSPTQIAFVIWGIVFVIIVIGLGILKHKKKPKEPWYEEILVGGPEWDKDLGLLPGIVFISGFITTIITLIFFAPS